MQLTCTDYVRVISLLYGILNWGEAYLIHTWLMREQRLAQVKINQSINVQTDSHIQPA